jgi:arylsulfatase A-like enzyme
MTRHPHILFILPDQLRRHAVGHLGGPVPTPAIDRLADEGVSFARCYCAYPMCTPSRAALLTGRPCHALRDNAGRPYMFNDRLLDLDEATYAKALTAAGYRCAYLGKWHNNDRRGFVAPGPRRQGFNDAFSGLQCGSDRLRPFHLDDAGHKIGGETDRWEPDYQTDLAIDLLRHADDPVHGGRPMCVVISFNPPHEPYDVLPADHRQRFNLAREQVRDVRPNVPAAMRDEARELAVQYHAQVSGVDACVGRLLDALEDCGMTERTLVVFTSDHGDALLSHGLRGKNQFYEEAAAVPLVMRFPGRLPRGRRVDRVTGHVDVAPTLLHLAGVDIPDRMMGASLTPYLFPPRDAHAPRDDGDIENTAAAFLEVSHPWFDWLHGQGFQGHRRAIVTHRWKLVVREGIGGAAEPWELFDLRDDPHELSNLARDPACLTTIHGLGRRLLQWMARTDDDFFDKMLAGMDPSERDHHRHRLREA